MLLINVTLIALSTTAAIFIAAALRLRGRLGMLMLSAGLFSVVAILAVTVNSQWMTALDTSVWNWFDAHRSYKWQRDSNGLFDDIGNPLYVAIAGLVSGTILAVRARSARRVVVVTGAVGAGAAIEQALKALAERTPENLLKLHDGPVVGWSPLDYAHTFPSGHVTGAATLLGMIAVCLGKGRSRTVAAALSVPVVAGVLFVAWLALYVRAHIFGDVIGGMVLGGALVAAGAAALMPTTRKTLGSPDKRQIPHAQTRTV
ncbi:phosphatase PAP2 family protein [Mycolicibacterium sphagni]|uniref:Phosphatidic acid phosphatase type 2/haloperoxidase domain-containing protein n=1 Tax=Mycolicibacterium sphagni TaxID=1786 RepID=A0A255DMI7_9MYCO|nr:phosphatase PAP2 family protein [Mycolicibacterium sphagni]OYN80657.1 hypothetical protein CG716_07275 [Mycolicibacterium sphagni]